MDGSIYNSVESLLYGAYKSELIFSVMPIMYKSVVWLWKMLSMAIRPNTLILTMYFLWSKGENKLHFSIFWKSIICKEKKKKINRESFLFISKDAYIVTLENTCSF